MDNQTRFTPAEMMITTAARALADERVVFVGVGLPNIACNLAKRTGSPDLELVYESGVFGACPARLPLSIGDPTLVSGAISVVGMADLFLNYLQGGRIDSAFLGAAQIDRFGNLNSTVIGDYFQPKVRLPGSGGACEIAIHAKKVYIIMPLSKRGFVEKLDYITSPGHLTGTRGERANSGMPGSGPRLVITNKAVFDFREGEMTLSSIHPGYAVEEIQDEVSWPLNVAEDLGITAPPSDEELRIIREELDPGGIYTTK